MSGWASPSTETALDFLAHAVPLALLEFLASVPVVMLFAMRGTLRIIRKARHHIIGQLLDLSLGDEARSNRAIPHHPSYAQGDRA